MVLENSSFKEKTIAGLKWNTLGKIFDQSIVLIVGIILARLLSPEEFGLIGMVTVITGFTNVFVDFGFASAIIQNPKTEESQWSSVFWFNLLVGLALSVLLSILAPLIAHFYDQPILKFITISISWLFFLQGFNVVQQALFKKQLKFKEIVTIQVISQAIAGVIAIIAALKGYSYWSLIIQMYVLLIINIIGFWSISKWKPSWQYKTKHIKELLPFTLPLVGTQSLNYWTRNADYLMIGKVLGENALGVYTQAYRIMLLPLQSISSVISGVMFPAYAIIQEDKVRIKKIYLQITRLVAFITFPLMFGLVVVAEPFILTLLGIKWTGVIPILQILAPLGATQSIGSLNGNIFLSQGATRLQFKVGGLARVFIIIMMLLGLFLGGLKGIAFAYLLSSIATSFVMYHFMGKLIYLSIREILLNLSKIFFAATFMAIGVLIIEKFLLPDISAPLKLIFLITSGIVIYLIFVALFKIDEYKTLISLVKNRQ